jgi:DNA/RNA-binding domain of Phe-tRNA-synthetase-like protein
VTTDPFFVSTPEWQSTYPGAVAGVLTMRGVTNPETHPELDRVREQLETDLRARYADMTRAEIRATGHFPAYDAYYKRFGQNYHVLMQLDSIVNKGKSIPSRAALVEAGFMAELDHGLLTGAHDLDDLTPPILIDSAGPDLTYIRYNGEPQICKPNDMLKRDQTGVLSSIISGPAQYARITPATTAVLFNVYAPAGINESDVQDHLRAIETTVRLFSPNAETIRLVTITAGL